jgi:hypothetical protein
MKQPEYRIAAVFSVIASIAISCNPLDKTAKPVILEFISPVTGGVWSVTDSIPIEIRYYRDSISRAVIEFSTDKGKTYDYMTAVKKSEIIGEYSHNSYKWVPGDNAITDSSQVLLRVFNYVNHEQSVTIPVPLTIYP